MRIFFVKLIKIYQMIFSPDTGLVKSFYPFGVCRYYPTCSEYGRQSIQKYGVTMGSLYALGRILRCNPLSKGGYDPIIKK
jgi:uncharacterized protein